MNLSNPNQKLPKSELTKLRITNTFLGLIQIKRWDKITVKEICSKLNITRGTFYQYYEDIYDVMEKIQNQILSDLERISEHNIPSSLPRHPIQLSDFENQFDFSTSDLFRAWYKYCAENKSAFLSLLHPENGDDYFKKRFKTLLCKYIDIEMDHDGFPNDKLRLHFHNLVFDSFFLIMYGWITNDIVQELSIDQLCDIQNTWRIGAYYQYARGLAHPQETKPSDLPQSNMEE